MALPTQAALIAATHKKPREEWRVTVGNQHRNVVIQGSRREAAKAGKGVITGAKRGR